MTEQEIKDIAKKKLEAQKKGIQSELNTVIDVSVHMSKDLAHRG